MNVNLAQSEGRLCVRSKRLFVLNTSRDRKVTNVDFAMHPRKAAFIRIPTPSCDRESTEDFSQAGPADQLAGEPIPPKSP